MVNKRTSRLFFVCSSLLAQTEIDSTFLYSPVQIFQNDSSICLGQSIEIAVIDSNYTSSEWNQSFYESFSGGLTQQGWITADGSWGGQAYDSEGNWYFTSDWNYLAHEIPHDTDEYTSAIEVRYFDLSTTVWSIGFRNNNYTWNQSDDTGYRYREYPDSATLYLDDVFQFKIDKPTQNQWHTIRVESLDDSYKFYIDEVLIYMGFLNGEETFGNALDFRVHTPCCPGSPQPILNMDYVKTEYATNVNLVDYTWSTGATTPSIMVHPTESTIYSVQKSFGDFISLDSITVSTSYCHDGFSTSGGDSLVISYEVNLIDSLVTICQNDSLSLQTLQTSESNYVWSTNTVASELNIVAQMDTAFYVQLLEENVLHIDSIIVDIVSSVVCETLNSENLLASVQNLIDSLNTNTSLVQEELVSCSDELSAHNLSLPLELGWNIIGYSCTTEVDAAQAFSSIVEHVTLVKNNNGEVYMPEYDFNGIGSLIPAYGYQVKMLNGVDSFNICE